MSQRSSEINGIPIDKRYKQKVDKYLNEFMGCPNKDGRIYNKLEMGKEVAEEFLKVLNHMNDDTKKDYQDEMFWITEYCDPYNNNDQSFKVRLNPVFQIDYIEEDKEFNNKVKSENVKTEQVMGLLNWDDYDHEKELLKMREEFTQDVQDKSFHEDGNFFKKFTDDFVKKNNGFSEESMEDYYFEMYREWLIVKDMHKKFGSKELVSIDETTFPSTEKGES